jgi:hypothetical protein
MGNFHLFSDSYKPPYGRYSDILDLQDLALTSVQISLEAMDYCLSQRLGYFDKQTQISLGKP